MGMDKGGLTEHFRRVVRACLGLSGEPGDPPQIDRLALYRAEVKAAASDGQHLDLQPSDPRVPGHQNVPVRMGLPGAVAVVQPGAVVLLGWEGGDPGRPYCVPSWESGAVVQKLVANAQQLFLGSESGAEGILTRKDGQVLYAAINAAVPTPQDGGAALKAAILSALGAAGWGGGTGDGHLGSSTIRASR